MGSGSCQGLYRIGAPNPILATTRNQNVLVDLAAEEQSVDLLSTNEALRVLAYWVFSNSNRILPPEATEVARECGHLPLALTAVGAMVRLGLQPKAWQDALIRIKRADFGADLSPALDASIEALPEQDRQRYLELAVFPGGQPIPENPLCTFWNLDETDARACMARFVTRSLATWAKDETAIVLHDVQHDLIRKRREKELAGLHLRLVEGVGCVTETAGYLCVAMDRVSPGAGWSQR